MKGRSGDIIDMLEWSHVDVCCIREVRGKGASARYLTGKEHRYKIFWVGNSDGVDSVGILLDEKWVYMVPKVVRVCDRILKFILVLQSGTVTIILAHILQLGLLD